MGLSISARRRLETLFANGNLGGLSDEELLARFLRRDDASSEAAFEVLVDRHGSMVLATCLRIVHDPEDAADAYQATFFVLAKKAATIRNAAALASWLHRVARHAAIRARRRVGRRRDRERGAAVSTFETVAPIESAAEAREVLAALDEELVRLPGSFRAPLVLCHLEGLTHEEAAARLGCPVGTVRSRLARGRGRLRDRLTRRGLAPAAVAAVLSGVSRSVSASPPGALIAATARSAMVLADGVSSSALASSASAVPLVLMEGVIQAMTIRTWSRLALVLGLAACASGVQTLVARPPAVADAPAQVKSKESRGEWAELAGRWDVVEIVKGGKTVAVDQAGFDECRVLAPKRDAKTGGESRGWLILTKDSRLFCEFEVREIDLDAKPKTIDLFTVRNVFAGKDGAPAEMPFDYATVFRLEGDDWTVCLGPPQGKRPNEVASGKGSDALLVRFRRRPDRPAPSPPSKP